MQAPILDNRKVLMHSFSTVGMFGVLSTYFLFFGLFFRCPQGAGKKSTQHDKHDESLSHV